MVSDLRCQELLMSIKSLDRDANERVLAVAVIYLLLVILLKSFALPLVILVTVPIAATGEILGLALLNLYMDQPLDMLTMLGFIILTGVVVNNAILMVEQTLWHINMMQWIHCRNTGSDQ